MEREYFNIEEAGFYKPYKDITGKVEFMRYLNFNLSYGYSKTEDRFYLCESPTLEATTTRIISEHDNFSEMREAYYLYRTHL